MEGDWWIVEWAVSTDWSLDNNKSPIRRGTSALSTPVGVMVLGVVVVVVAMVVARLTKKGRVTKRRSYGRGDKEFNDGREPRL